MLKEITFYICFLLQDDTLKGDIGSVDISTEKNMDGLVEVGKALLKKNVSRVNLETGHYEPISDHVTNEEALKRFIISFLLILKEKPSLLLM